MAVETKTGRGATSVARRRKLVQRLWSAAETQVADIEARLVALSGDSASFEREARALGLLAKFLKELVSIECLMDEAGAQKKAAKMGGNMGDKTADEDEDAPPRNLEDFRRELARRLDQMRHGRDSERNFDQSEPELA